MPTGALSASTPRCRPTPRGSASPSPSRTLPRSSPRPRAHRRADRGRLMPKRGLAALAITTVALILLISFKTPEEVPLDRTTGNVAVVEDVGGSAGSTDPAASAPTTNAPTAKATPQPTDSSAAGGASAAATTVD